MEWLLILLPSILFVIVVAPAAYYGIKARNRFFKSLTDWLDRH